MLLFQVISAMALAEEVAGRATTAAAFFGDFVDDGTGSVIEHDWEAGHRLASSPAEGTGEQATGRVDVPGEAHNCIFKQKVAAASLTAASQQTPVLTARSFGSPLEKWEKDNPVSRIFVRDLMGKSVSLWVQSRITVGELTLAVSVAEGVPLEFFYLTIDGHILGGQDLLRRFGALPGTHIRMNGRLRGGVRPPSEYIPGQWTCGVCGMEGCWPARTVCYPCAAPRSGAAPSRVHPHGPQRERAYPGQPAAPQPVPMNPARRALRVDPCCPC